MKRKGRRLSQEEERLWQKITDTATPLERRKSFLKEEEKSSASAPSVSAAPLPPFEVGERAPIPPTETRISAPDQPLRMDRKTYSRMKRGKSSPEGRLDLHGMTVDVAHSALTAFLLRSHGQGKRLVLVITGKGRREDNETLYNPSRGILRRQVPHWLEQPPLRQIVLQVSPAHPRHGGSGALYVYLRR
jgi:DNA-nicking Smr family endonuclease